MIYKKAIPPHGGTALLYQDQSPLSFSALLFRVRKCNGQQNGNGKYQSRKDHTAQAQRKNKNGRHNHGVHLNRAGGGLRGAAGRSFSLRGGSVHRGILICISKTEHCITSFHVSLMFDGLILAHEYIKVNPAYLPKKKRAKPHGFAHLNNLTKNAAGNWAKRKRKAPVLAL